MKYKMLTGASREEIMRTNIFEFLSLIGASEPVVSEDSIRLMKIFDNHLLLNNKKTANQYPELIKSHKRVVSEKGMKVWNKRAEFESLNKLKAMIRGING